MLTGLHYGIALPLLEAQTVLLVVFGDRSSWATLNATSLTAIEEQAYRRIDHHVWQGQVAYEHTSGTLMVALPLAYLDPA